MDDPLNRLEPLPISLCRGRFVFEHKVVGFECDAAKPLGHRAISGAAIVPLAGSFDLFEPVAKMHDAQVVKIVVRDAKYVLSE